MNAKQTALMTALAALLDTHDAVDVIDALSDCADCAGDAAERTGDQRQYHRAATMLRKASATVRHVERRDDFGMRVAIDMLADDIEESN